MDIDIEAALADRAPAVATGKCKVQRWLDEIPPAAPSLSRLVKTIETPCKKSDPGRYDPEHYVTVPETLKVLRRLKFEVSDRTLREHRNQECRCFD